MNTAECVSSRALAGVHECGIQLLGTRYGEIWGDTGRYGEIRGDTGRYGAVLLAGAHERAVLALERVRGQLEHPALGDGAARLRKKWRGRRCARAVRRRSVWKAPRCVGDWSTPHSRRQASRKCSERRV